MKSGVKRILLLLAVLAAYAGVVHWLIGWPLLLKQARAAGATPALLVFGGLFMSYALRALRLRAALPAGTGASLAELARIFAVHNAANWILPARSGEASLPLLLRQRFRLSLTQGTGVLLWLRVIDLHVLAVLGGAALIASTADGWRIPAMLGLCAGLALPLLARLTAFRLSQRWPRLTGLSVALPHSPRALGLDLLLGWSAWGVKLAALGLAFSLLAHLSFWTGLLGALGGDVAAVLPIHAPLGAGTYEAGVMFALAPVEPPLRATLAAAVQLHGLSLLAALAGGAWGLWHPATARAHASGVEKESP